MGQQTERTAKYNLAAWIAVAILTLACVGVVFFGPETHSEVGEAPTLLGKVMTVVGFFLIVGAVFLPISPRPNQAIVALGTFALLVKLCMAVVYVPKDLNAPGISMAWGFLFALAMVTVFLIFKVKKIWQHRRQ